jgi:hypothetical protein
MKESHMWYTNKKVSKDSKEYASKLNKHSKKETKLISKTSTPHFLSTLGIEKRFLKILER